MASTSIPCGNCGEPATSRCAGCIDGVDVHGERTISAPSYCGKDCQTAHWPMHKKACNDSKHRKQLYRAGQFAQEIFEYTRRKCFEHQITEVHTESGRLTVEKAPAEPGINIVDFAGHLFSSENDARATLVHGWQCWAVSRMHKLVSKLLLGCCQKVQEVHAVLLPLQYKICMEQNGLCPEPTTKHVLFKLDLKDGNEYALDLAGAQFGKYRTVNLWNEYRVDFFHDGYSTHALGWSVGQDEYALSIISAKLAASGEPTVRRMFRQHRLTQTGLNTVLNKLVQEWSNRALGDIGKIVRGESSVFEEQAALFRQELETATLEYVRENKGNGTLSTCSGA